MEQKPETQEDAVLKLIEKVDGSFEKRLWRIYLSRKIDFRYYANFFSAFYYLTLFIAILFLFASITKELPSISQQPQNIQIAIGLAVVATFTALASFGVNLQKSVEPMKVSDILFEYNFKLLKDEVAGKNPALFKGLIVLKSKHPDLSLMDVLDLPITKDKLFEILYK